MFEIGLIALAQSALFPLAGDVETSDLRRVWHWIDFENVSNTEPIEKVGAHRQLDIISEAGICLNNRLVCLISAQKMNPPAAIDRSSVVSRLLIDVEQCERCAKQWKNENPSNGTEALRN